MIYRTKTYIAGDWDGDKDLIEQLAEWNSSHKHSLHFLPAHDLRSARDSSLNCSIKESLRSRLAASKTFVLVVGNKTCSVSAGSCKHCSDYSGYYSSCNRFRSTDLRSYIQFECDYAIKHGLKIVVLYNSTSVDKSKCPECLRAIGTHINAYYRDVDNKYYWDYPAIKKAIGS